MNYDKRSADTAALLKGSKGVEVMTTSEKSKDAESCQGRLYWYKIV